MIRTIIEEMGEGEFLLPHPGCGGFSADCDAPETLKMCPISSSNLCAK